MTRTATTIRARRPLAQAGTVPPATTAPAFAPIPPAQVLGRLAALQAAPTADLKEQWRTLFGKEPPPFNRPYLQSRLAYQPVDKMPLPHG